MPAGYHEGETSVSLNPSWDGSHAYQWSREDEARGSCSIDFLVNAAV